MQTTANTVLMTGALALGGMLGTGATPASAQVYNGGSGAAFATAPSFAPSVPSPTGNILGARPSPVGSAYPAVSGPVGYGRTAPAPAAYQGTSSNAGAGAGASLVPASYPGSAPGQVRGASMAPGADSMPAASTAGGGALAAPGAYPNDPRQPVGSGSPAAPGSYWGPTAPTTNGMGPGGKPRRVTLLRRFINLFDRNRDDDDGDTSNAPSAYRDPATGLNMPFPRPWMNKQ